MGLDEKVDLILVGKIVVDVGGGHAQPGGKLAHAEVLESILNEMLQSYFKDAILYPNDLLSGACCLWYI
jgi:hypothetical protein